MTARVLICDDEREIATLIASLFETLGMDAAFEVDPHRAITRVRDEAFDLVTLDFMMPELDGGAVMQLMRAIRPELPFLIITGLDSADPRLVRMRAELGRVNVLTKPFGTRELSEALQAMGITVA